MKNKKFFYLQYDKINWQNQEKTKINSFVNNFVIKEIISKHRGSVVRVFDIGFGIGFFIKMLHRKLVNKHKNIILEGCEPSKKNYKHFLKKPPSLKNNIKVRTHNKPFLDVQTKNKFDFITAIYVFPHFTIDDLQRVVKKIYSMLDGGGKFVLVVANQKYLERKLKTKKDLFIENNVVKLGNKQYKEVLHYSDIPKIGKIIDYNREERFWLDLFEKNKFQLISKKDLNDNGFICTVFVFEK